MYQLSLAREAGKDMERLRGDLWRRLRDALLALGENPRPHGCVKLKDRDGYRIRVGDYRVIYAVDDDRRLVDVNAVRHRSKAYE